MKLNTILQSLIEAEAKALRLFDLIEERGLITAGQTEKELNDSIYRLAEEELNIRKYWHKRIVRAGENTLFPYKENPPNLDITDDTILFLDLGPVFNDFEADIGRTYVLGEDPRKMALKSSVEEAWFEVNDHFWSNEKITASELYHFCQTLASDYGWSFGGEIAGHLVGKFPHERLEDIPKDCYIHAENNLPMHEVRKWKNSFWIIEIHFVDKDDKIGGFYEQLALRRI
ncbi:MAG: M24 family metallopeptidase [Brumimicrobium sp.]|nr:M24 family metallopeptidase [Brumimicrobium sp.]